MKYLIIILSVFLFSCKKEVNNIQRPAIDPSITSVTWRTVYAGANASTQFSVSLVSDSNDVDMVKLFIVPTAERWEVKKPQTGTYIMYDHIGDGPNGYYYYFVFYKHDGTQVQLNQFQVN